MEEYDAQDWECFKAFEVERWHMLAQKGKAATILDDRFLGTTKPCIESIQRNGKSQLDV